MPCKVTTNCSLCGQEMSGPYPQSLADAVQALIDGHNELRKCHRENEEKEKEDMTWRDRHDSVVAARNHLKRQIIEMREAGEKLPAENRMDVIASLSKEELMIALNKRLAELETALNKRLAE